MCLNDQVQGEDYFCTLKVLEEEDPRTVGRRLMLLQRTVQQWHPPSCRDEGVSESMHSAKVQITTMWTT